MNRRNFLTSATVSVGALGLTNQIKTNSVGGRLNEMEQIGHKFKFSLAAYSYRDLLSGDSPKLTLKDFVDDCAKFGLEGTELTSYYFPKNPTDEFIYDLKATRLEEVWMYRVQQSEMTLDIPKVPNEMNKLRLQKSGLIWLKG